MAAESFDPPKGYLFPGCGERQIRLFKMPCKRWFEYHCWESEQSSHAELWRHTHQRCTVLRRLLPSEADYEMYEVEFEDGFKAQVFADELLRSESHFTRAPYLS